jgi:hypothetical protein
MEENIKFYGWIQYNFSLVIYQTTTPLVAYVVDLDCDNIPDSTPISKVAKRKLKAAFDNVDSVEFYRLLFYFLNTIF